MHDDTVSSSRCEVLGVAGQSHREDVSKSVQRCHTVRSTNIVASVTEAIILVDRLKEYVVSERGRDCSNLISSESAFFQGINRKVTDFTTTLVIDFTHLGIACERTITPVSPERRLHMTPC